MSNTNHRVSVRAATLKKVLYVLDGMLTTESDRQAYQQIVHMLSDYEDACIEHEHTFIASISLLLDAISTHLEPNSRLAGKISLLRARLAPPLDDMELNAIRRAIERCADQVTTQSNIGEVQVRRLLNPMLSSFGLEKAESPDSLALGASQGSFQYVVDQEGIAHNQGLEKVMESLSTQKKILEGLAKSREYGKLLELELSTIRHIDEIETFEDKKTALLSELENIVRDHHQLTEYFHTVSSYLETMQNEGKRLNQELSRVTTLSLTDELTGLPNRRAFMKRLKDEISRASRYGNTLALTILDLDHFKSINDGYGHLAGDEILRHYAQNVLTAFRQNDLVARFGGEEFAVIFPNTSVDGAYKALMKVLKRANESNLLFERKNIALPSFSSGLVIYKPGESLESFVSRADDALYNAKKAGRNQVEILEAELESTD